MVNQSGGNAEAVAEHVLAHDDLCLVKRIGEMRSASCARGANMDRNIYMGKEIFGQHHRHHRARQCRAAGSPNCAGPVQDAVLAYDPYLTAEQIAARGAEKIELDELLRRADFVSVNCPLTDETREHDRARRICADAAACLFHHHRARLHP